MKLYPIGTRMIAIFWIGLSPLTPCTAVADENSEDFINCSAVVGEPGSADASSLLRLQAHRLRHEEPLESLSLEWLRWEPDTQRYEIERVFHNLELRGSINFLETSLEISSDRSARFSDIAPSITTLPDELGSQYTRLLFMSVDKIFCKYEIYNCRR